MAVTGVVGTVRWYHYAAAAINNYRVTRTEDGVEMLSATVVVKDAFKLTQRPLVFVAPWAVKRAGVIVRRGEWRWPIVSFTLSEAGQLTARLGRVESEILDERKDVDAAQPLRQT